jgi:crossover junction endodeoxyribonuclease RuvC
MKILGIDPGVAILGWSVLERAAGESSLKSYGCIRTEAGLPLTTRLLQIFDDLQTLIRRHEPDEVAIEALLFAKNAKALAHVGHTRGVILLAAGRAKLPIFEYAPRQVKLALTGSGAADKRQMQSMVQRRLQLDTLPTPDDAADAVAVALCHSQYAQALGGMKVTV